MDSTNVPEIVSSEVSLLLGISKKIVYEGILDGLKTNCNYEPSCFQNTWNEGVEETGLIHIRFEKCPLRKLPWHGSSCEIYSDSGKAKKCWRHKLPCTGIKKSVKFNLINGVLLVGQPAKTFFFSLGKHVKNCKFCSGYGDNKKIIDN